jgi:DNA polymerase/3'-5' exonuclease PolX
MDRETLVERLSADVDGVGEARANEIVDVLAELQDSEDTASTEMIRGALDDIESTVVALGATGKSDRARADRIRETVKDLRVLLNVSK